MGARGAARPGLASGGLFVASPSSAVATAGVVLELLGPCALRAGGEVRPLPPERRGQLLAWLACQDGWVSRERAAALLWPDRDGAAARRNLRGVLHDLRRARWPVAVEADGELLRWAVPTDRAAFERACAAGAFDEASRLVRGAFADGLEAGAPEPFVEWVRFERECIVNQWRHAVSRRLAQLDDASGREAFAASALRIDPLNEEVAHALIAALAATGRAADARACLRAFARRLAEEAGVQPSHRLVEAARRLDEPGTAVAQARAAAAPPATGDGFVGRRVECRELAALFAGGGCRWVTLLGGGGIGKSRLARVVADATAGAFPDGVRWIELRDLETREQVVGRLAQALPARLRGAADALDDVVASIANARMLIVLDNAEHLADAGALAASLLACPGVALLVTSRIRFGLPAEWVYPLDGLPVPDADETDAQVLRRFDAVTLFEARAKTVDAGFRLDAQAAAVRDLVRAVDGSPLAIELAAASVRALPVDMIVAALLAAPDDAAPRTRDATLRASFRRSWRLLSAGERAALARLSVFAGTFDAAAAHQVAQASLPMLNALADKSLLRRGEDRGLSLHPLVREFATERLADGDGARERHAAYFAQWFAARPRDGSGASRVAADAALPDGAVALRWACASGAAPVVERLAAPLCAVLDEHGRWGEGLALFRAATAAGEASLGATSAGHAELLRGLALFHYRRGDLDRCEACARQALRVATALRSRRGLDACLNLIGGALRQRGAWAQARRFFERAAARARAEGHADVALRATNNLATVEMASGHAARAIALCRELRARADDDADPLGAAMTLLILGNALRETGRPGDAERTYDGGLVHARRHRLATIVPYFLQALGNCRLDAGDAAGAGERLREALEAGGDALEPHVEATVRIGLARIAIAEGRADEAFAPLRAALALAARMGSGSWRAAVALRWGQALAAGGDVAGGARLMAIAARHPALDASVRTEAERMLDALALDAPLRAEVMRTALAADPLAVVDALRG